MSTRRALNDFSFRDSAWKRITEVGGDLGWKIVNGKPNYDRLSHFQKIDWIKETFGEIMNDLETIEAPNGDLKICFLPDTDDRVSFIIAAGEWSYRGAND